jgi:ATP-binding cassette, subfamily C (CFTR/MRP), member 1
MVVGSIQWEVYQGYFDALGKVAFYGMMFTSIASVALSLASSIWLGMWSQSNNESPNAVSYYIGVYVALSIGTVIANLLANLVGYAGAVTASAEMHNDIVHSLFMAPISFFDSTPLGRITNRMSKDMNMIDNTIMLNLQLITK